MTPFSNGSVPVVLRQRVIVSEGVVFDAEREVTLPFPPSAGLILYNTIRVPPGCDEPEEPVEEVACDLATGRIICYLPLDDYRPHISGSDDWTEAEVRERYRDWTLTRDEACMARAGRNDDEAASDPCELKVCAWPPVSSRTPPGT